MYELYWPGSKLGKPDAGRSDLTEARMLACRMLRYYKDKPAVRILLRRQTGWTMVQTVRRDATVIDIKEDLKTPQRAGNMVQGDHFVIRAKGRRYGDFIGRYLAVKPVNGCNAVDLNAAELVSIDPDTIVFRTIRHDD